MQDGDEDDEGDDETGEARGQTGPAEFDMSALNTDTKVYRSHSLRVSHQMSSQLRRMVQEQVGGNSIQFVDIDMGQRKREADDWRLRFAQQCEQDAKMHKVPQTGMTINLDCDACFLIHTCLTATSRDAVRRHSEAATSDHECGG